MSFKAPSTPMISPMIVQKLDSAPPPPPIFGAPQSRQPMRRPNSSNMQTIFNTPTAAGATAQPNQLGSKTLLGS